MYQYTVIIGNVGRDPELRYTPSGVAVTDFSVAVNERWTKDGEQQEKTTWFRVTCWRNLAEIVSKYVQKGRQVMVVGTLDATAWIDSNGEARAQLEITAREVKFLGSRSDGGGNSNVHDPFGEAASPETFENPDIPF